MGTFILVGPGRAGLSLGIALRDAGHDAVGVLARTRRLPPRRPGGSAPRFWSGTSDLPAADLLVVAVRDDAIAGIAGRLAPYGAEIRFAVHLSGLKPLSALAALSAAGPEVGSFHPLQSLPNAEDGAAALPGSWVAVTAGDASLREFLENVARSIGARPFALTDEHRDLYHAAASACSNYVITALALAEELFTLAGVPFEVAGPLVKTVAANAFRLGPAAALTGPIARGDVGTVADQLSAVAVSAPEMEDDYRAFAKATARIAGTTATFEEIL